MPTAASKKSKKKAAARRSTRTVTSAAPTRCDEYMTELLPVFVRARAGDDLELHMILCKSPFRVIVHLDEQPIMDEAQEDEFTLLLPALSPGRHALVWAYLAPSEPWQVVSEVSINDVVRFRQKKDSEGKKPFNRSFLGLEIV